MENITHEEYFNNLKDDEKDIILEILKDEGLSIKYNIPKSDRVNSLLNIIKKRDEK